MSVLILGRVTTTHFCMKKIPQNMAAQHSARKEEWSKSLQKGQLCNIPAIMQLQLIPLCFSDAAYHRLEDQQIFL